MVAATAKMNHSIRNRILGILGLLALGYLLLLAMMQTTAGATHEHMERVSTSLRPASSALDEAEHDYAEVRKEYKDTVTLEDQNALADAQKASDNLRAALVLVRSSLAASPELAGRADLLLEHYESIDAPSQQIYGAVLASKDNLSDELQAKVSALGKQNKQFEDEMEAFDATLAQEGRSEFAAVDSSLIHTRAIAWVVLIVAMIGCTGAWWVLQYKVILPLDRLARRMRDIAEGDGDLTGRVEVRGHDELDEVGRWFNVFIARIEQIVARVSGGANALAAAAGSLSDAAREAVSQAALQQDEAARITSSMNEISTAAFAISETTQKAAVDARGAEEQAQAGGRTIHATVETIQELLVANQATATRIEELGAATEAIGRIIGAIDDIANQTSLLALNASIESARAGEHGRGFAVVAAEVRRLAERTGKATGEISQAVLAIQAGTAEVVGAMRASMVQVASGVSSARSAGLVLESIIQGSEEVQKMVTQIASASAQQSYSTQSVNATLNKIAGIMESTTSGAENAVEGCDRLSHLAADLNELVGSFKVRDEQGDGGGWDGVRPAGSNAANRRWMQGAIAGLGRPAVVRS
jgi:methyl-accepting chemotaxis protein